MDPWFDLIVHLECGDRSSHFSSNFILYVFFLFLIWSIFLDFSIIFLHFLSQFNQFTLRSKILVWWILVGSTSSGIMSLYLVWTVLDSEGRENQFFPQFFVFSLAFSFLNFVLISMLLLHMFVEFDLLSSIFVWIRSFFFFSFWFVRNSVEFLLSNSFHHVFVNCYHRFSESWMSHMKFTNDLFFFDLKFGVIKTLSKLRKSLILNSILVAFCVKSLLWWCLNWNFVQYATIFC